MDAYIQSTMSEALTNWHIYGVKPDSKNFKTGIPSTTKFSDTRKFPIRNHKSLQYEVSNNLCGIFYRFQKNGCKVSTIDVDFFYVHNEKWVEIRAEN